MRPAASRKLIAGAPSRLPVRARNVGTPAIPRASLPADTSTPERVESTRSTDAVGARSLVAEREEARGEFGGGARHVVAIADTATERRYSGFTSRYVELPQCPGLRSCCWPSPSSPRRLPRAGRAPDAVQPPPPGRLTAPHCSPSRRAYPPPGLVAQDRLQIRQTRVVDRWSRLCASARLVMLSAEAMSCA